MCVLMIRLSYRVMMCYDVLCMLYVFSPLRLRSCRKSGLLRSFAIFVAQFSVHCSFEAVPSADVEKHPGLQDQMPHLHPFNM